MVKNAIGGNKAKKQGRKHVALSASSSSSNKLRIATEEGELYAYVLKIYGNGMCQVLGIDSKEYLCHIRNKFRGRSKRDNMVIAGSWVLVGLREWESDGAKKSCDLLEIYGVHEIEQLKNRVYENWSVFPSNDFGGGGGGARGGGGIGEDELKFTENATEDICAPQKIPRGVAASYFEKNRDECGDMYDINTDIVNIDDI